MSEVIIGYAPADGRLILGRHRDNRGTWVEPLYSQDDMMIVAATELDKAVLGADTDRVVAVSRTLTAGVDRYRLAAAVSFHGMRVEDADRDPRRGRGGPVRARRARRRLRRTHHVLQAGAVMTTVDELGLDPRTLGEEALRRLAEYDKLMGDLQYLTGPEPGLTYHRVTLADGNEVRGHDAQRYAAHRPAHPPGPSGHPFDRDRRPEWTVRCGRPAAART
jgi:hypothetical protein